MRTFITCAILTVATLTVSAAPAFAQGVDAAALVDGWYHKYLGRHIDPAGLSDHMRAIRNGTPLDVVEASILASPEYYARSGGSPEGYVAALNRDVLGIRIGGFEFTREVDQVLRQGRTAVALRVLSQRSPVVAYSAPRYIEPAPVVVLRPSTVMVPSYYHDHYRHGHAVHPSASLYVRPAPGISLRVGIR